MIYKVYLWTPKPWKMKVFIPKIWVIYPLKMKVVSSHGSQYNQYIHGAMLWCDITSSRRGKKCLQWNLNVDCFLLPKGMVSKGVQLESIMGTNWINKLFFFEFDSSANDSLFFGLGLWFGFLRSPCKKELLLRGTPRIPNHQPKPPPISPLVQVQ